MVTIIQLIIYFQLREGLVLENGVSGQLLFLLLLLIV